MRVLRWSYLPLLLLAIPFTHAQTPETPAQHESALAAEFRLEGDRFQNGCVSFSFGSCAELLFTDHPMHIAVGTIAPQNGFSAGLALINHYDAKKWFFKWDTDVVGSANGSWRAGVYMKIVPTGGLAPKKGITVHVDDQQGSHAAAPYKSNIKLVSAPLITVYAQGISLNTIGFFGLGPQTVTAGQSFFGMTQTILGSNAILPLPWSGKLALSAFGEMNGRFVDIRGDHGQSSPSIEVLYNPLTAPGIASQPGFIQFGEGLRIKPALFNSKLRLNYSARFQEFVAPSNSNFSFQRFTADFSHEIPLTKIETRKADDRNAPDECSMGATEGDKLKCPEVSASRNRYGTITLRALLSESFTSGASVVPFYFQPTLGGADINGSPVLPSYQDYRYRGPNLMFFHADLEHSIPGLDRLKYPVPLGFLFGADTGRVALTRGDLDFQHMRHSFSTGLTVRAGGFPEVFLLFAFGGKEGTHTIGNINTSLLGGSARPSLF